MNLDDIVDLSVEEEAQKVVIWNQPKLGIVGNVNAVVKVELHSRGAIVRHYDIPVVSKDCNYLFEIPQEHDIGSYAYNAASFEWIWMDRTQRRNTIQY